MKRSALAAAMCGCVLAGVLAGVVVGVVIGVVVGTAAGSARAQGPDGVVLLLSRLEKTLQTSDPALFNALVSANAPPDLAAQLAPRIFMRGTVRAVVKERERDALQGALPGDGYRLIVEILTEAPSTARIVTARLDVRRARDDTAPDAWRIVGATPLSIVEGLHRLGVSAATQFAARGLVLTSEDLTLTFADGSVFAIDSSEGTTGLVILGRGQMDFLPKPQTERDQVRLFAGAETLSAPFDTVFVRLHPRDFAALGASLSPMTVDPRQLQRAREIFGAESQRSFSLDLGDLSREPWYLIPPAGDFLAEIRTRGRGHLTYARSFVESEDVTLFERGRGRDIARYPSARKLQLRGPSYDEDDLVAYDILDYDINASIDPERAFINGRAGLRIVARHDHLSSLNVRLAESLTVSSVSSPELGRLLHVRVRTRDSIVVNLPLALRRGTEITLQVNYSGRLLSQSIETEGQTPPPRPEPPPRPPAAGEFAPEAYYLLSGRAYWYPQGPFTDYATARLRVTVPSPYGCVGSGELVDGFPRAVPGAAEPTREFVFQSLDPIRYLAVIVSRLRTASREDVALDRGTLALSMESVPRLQGRGREVATWAADIVRFYASLLEEAPYASLTVALVEHLVPGGHGPAHVVMLHHPPPATPLVHRDDPSTFTDFPEFFLAHEVAHQWWGQAVGWENYHEQWLSEGFAQYFAALYARHKHGDEKFVQMLRVFRRWGIEASDQGPIYLGYRLGQIRGDRRVFRALVYNKGAGVLHMLRRLVGDDVFFLALRRFYRDQKFAKAGTEDLRRAFEEETGQSYQRFFDRWIYKSRIPRIRFSSTASDGSVTVTFRQREDLVFDVPVTVSLTYADGRMEDVVVPVTSAVVERTIPASGVVRSVRVNRDFAALAEFEE